MIRINGKTNPLLRELDYTLADLERRFGAGIVTKLGDAPHLLVQVIPTGFPQLDRALGVGGLPRGRITNIYGLEGSGKTTLCLHVIAEAQKRGGSAVFVDMDHALDPVWAARRGVSVNRLYVAQPNCGEEALEIAEAMVRADADVVVVDSTAALVPQEEVAGEAGDVCTSQGALMSQAMRKLAGPVHKHGATLIFTSQIRYRHGVLFGDSEKPTGGRALRHTAGVQIRLYPQKSIKVGGEAIGIQVLATVKKSKVSAPYRTAQLAIYFEEA